METLRVVAIGFTNRCNLNCIHCARETGKETMARELHASFFVSVLREAKTLGAQQVNLTGGEIFCRPDCLDLIAEAYALGYFISIETNGTLMTSATLNRLSQYGDRLRISYSVDGVTADTHDAVRGAGSFDRTMRAIHLTTDRNLNARIITVLSQGNLNEISAMTQLFVQKLGLGFRLLPNIMQYGRGVYACNTIGVPYAEAWELLDGFFFGFLLEQNDDRHSVELNPALVPIDVPFHHVCPWGINMIGVGPTGIASLCHVANWDARFIFGDLTQTTLTEIWTKNPLLKQFRTLDPDTLHGVCGNCLARTLCRGGCRLHAATRYPADPLAPDPQCQDIYNLGHFHDYALEDETRECTYTEG